MAVDLAVAHNGEVINGDAMQMYAGLPIITNKITPEETKGISHHLLGNVSLSSQPWTVLQFKKEAEGIIKEIRSRGKLPILVGGTHYYTQSLLFEDTLVGKDSEDEKSHLSREDLESKYPILLESEETILNKLREVDPVMADRWHPKERKRIKRSLEIYLTTGRKASEIYKEQWEKKNAQQTEDANVAASSKDKIVTLPSTLLFWVHTERETLKTRLDNRIDKMLHRGLLDEVRGISAFEKAEIAAGHNIDRGSGIWVSIGFKEFTPYLAAEADPSATEKDKQKALNMSIEKTKAATRQYASSQVKWIRTKLITALNTNSALQNLYLVDATDASQFQQNAADPAIEVCAKFLRGEELPKPETLTPAAAELLEPTRKFEHASRQDLWVRKTCETCNQVAVSEEAWEIHLKSRAHRARVRKANKPPRVPRATDTTGDGGNGTGSADSTVNLAEAATSSPVDFPTTRTRNENANDEKCYNEN